MKSENISDTVQRHCPAIFCWFWQSLPSAMVNFWVELLRCASAWPRAVYANKFVPTSEMPWDVPCTHICYKSSYFGIHGQQIGCSSTSHSWHCKQPIRPSADQFETQKLPQCMMQSHPPSFDFSKFCLYWAGYIFCLLQYFWNLPVWNSNIKHVYIFRTLMNYRVGIYRSNSLTPPPGYIAGVCDFEAACAYLLSFP